MAIRIPLVIVAGEIEQLQAGDTIAVNVSGVNEVSLTNDEASPVVIGAPVYMDAADGFKKAKADAGGTALPIGLVAQTSITNAVAGIVGVSGVLTATTAQWDAVAGTTGGLAFGVRYYLSAATAGILTPTAPTTVGQYVVEVGIALSTTELKIDIQKRILL